MMHTIIVEDKNLSSFTYIFVINLLDVFLKDKYLRNESKKKIGKNFNGEEYLATCLGHREGTGCYHRSRSTQKRENWENWQLCHECARKLHPEYYKGKKNHGVRKVKGTRYSELPFSISEMPTVE